ncbi:MAG: M12 family metallo-peptidase [Chloroflexota bacterium]
MNILHTVRGLLLAVLLLNAAAPAAAPAAAARLPQALPALFIEPAPGNTAEPSARPAAAPGAQRERFVMLDRAALDRVQPPAAIDLNLFPDLRLTAQIDSLSRRDATEMWTAHLPGQPGGQVFAVVQDGQLSLDVQLADGYYQVRPAGNGLHTIQQIDQSAYPEELPPIEIDAGPQAGLDAAAAGSPDASAAPDDGSQIDVLVAWTPAAERAAGGAAAIQSLINLAVLETNASYTNSGVHQRIKLVKMVRTEYLQSGSLQTDLLRLQAAGDKHMDELHTLRDAYHADLVSLIIKADDYCGLAYHMSSVSSAFAANGFSVVASSCATGYYSFAHELGHNMGARHDWYIDDARTPQRYAHGYVNPAGGWRTIMSYNDLCRVRGISCTRIPYWSNPAVSYNGAPTGVAVGTDASCTADNKNNPACDADDHRTLNDTAVVVANFRQSVPLVPPAPFWEADHYLVLPVIRK